MTEIKINLTLGTKKHSIQFKSERTLKELTTEIERITGIAVHKQKLIFKGRTLDKVDETLKSMGIINKSKLMLITREANMEVGGDVETTLGMVGKEVEKIDENFQNTNKKVQELQKGVGLKRMITIAEEYTRQLERLDSLTLSTPTTRAKRKKIVDQILTSLQSCDECINKLKNSS